MGVGSGVGGSGGREWGVVGVGSGVGVVGVWSGV